MPQNPIPAAVALTVSNTQSLMHLDSLGNLRVVEADDPNNYSTALAVTTAQQLKTSGGVVKEINNLNITNIGYLTTTQVAALSPTYIGALYDALATTGVGALTSTQVAALAATQIMGYFSPTELSQQYNMPYKNGLVWVPGPGLTSAATSIASLTYR